MAGYDLIGEGVYLVGGPNISRSEDATVFVVDFGGELIMIDAGESRGVDKIPQCVQDAMKKKPQLIVTDAACTKVLATLDGRPDRKQADAFEKKVAEAAATAAPAKK